MAAGQVADRIAGQKHHDSGLASRLANVFKGVPLVDREPIF